MPIPLLGAVGIGSMIDKISGLFNSPSAKIFADTLSDVLGVVGLTLTPVFRVFNTVARMIGDTLATVSPGFEALFSIFEDSFESMKPIFAAVQSAIVAIINAWLALQRGIQQIGAAILSVLGLGDGINIVVDVVNFATKAFAGLSAVITVLTSNIAKFIADPSGYRLPNLGKQISDEYHKALAASKNITSSFGAGGMGGQHTNVEDYEKKLHEAAFGAPTLMKPATEDAQKIANDLLFKIALNTGKDGPRAVDNAVVGRGAFIVAAREERAQNDMAGVIEAAARMGMPWFDRVTRAMEQFGDNAGLNRREVAKVAANGDF